METKSTFEKDFFKYVILPIILFLAICTVSSCRPPVSKQLAAYEEYYNKTEKLLDELEAAHNWSDTVGEGDTAIEYYQAKQNLNK